MNNKNENINLSAEIRAKLTLTQTDLAYVLDVSLRTVQRWEAHPNEMSRVSKMALRWVYENYPRPLKT